MLTIENTSSSVNTGNHKNPSDVGEEFKSNNSRDSDPRISSASSLDSRAFFNMITDNKETIKYLRNKINLFLMIAKFLYSEYDAKLQDLIELECEGFTEQYDLVQHILERLILTCINIDKKDAKNASKNLNQMINKTLDQKEIEPQLSINDIVKELNYLIGLL